MRTSARSLSALALLTLAAPARAADAPDPNLAPTQALLREAAELERAENCEAAYKRYGEVVTRAAELLDKAKASELEAIAANKADKLEGCFRACQPTDRQRNLVATAKQYAGEGEVRRATQMVKRLLVGKNEKCAFWGDARTFLRGLPKQAEEQDGDKVDPCEVTAEVQAALDDARSQTRRHREELEGFEGERKKLASKMTELIELFHAIDGTRTRLFELREEYLDCEAVHGRLVADASELKETFTRTEGLIFSTYQDQVAGLAAKVRKFQKALGEKDKALAASADELTRLKKQFEELSNFNEELYDDLFALAGSESISFATTVEGKRVDPPAEEIQALMADQSRVLKALESKYPEYFQDGVNVEGLKRRRFVLEKLGQMMEKQGKRGADQKLGYGRAVAELEQSIKLMDKTIAAGEKAQRAKPVPTAAGGAPDRTTLLLGGLGVLAVVGLSLLAVAMTRRKRQAQ